MNITKVLSYVSGIALGGLVLCITIPALRGPINRVRNTANETLEYEYVIDNYKAQYLNLHEKRENIVNTLIKFKTELRVAEKKLEYLRKKLSTVTTMVLDCPENNDATSIANANCIKAMYDGAVREVENYEAKVQAYNEGISKLIVLKENIDVTLAKTKTNVEVLSSKKVLVDSLKSINSTLENLNGVGEDVSLTVNIEKLDDDYIRQAVRLETINAESGAQNNVIQTVEELRAFKNSLKPSAE